MALPDLKTDFPWLKERLIFLTRHGSRAYGTSTPESDEDYRGLAIPPLSYFFGLNNFEQVMTKVPDTVIFDLRKFVRLATQANPNCIELLYTDPEDHLLVTDIGKKLLANRDLFLSQRAFGTFRGYAKAQLNKLQNGVVNSAASGPGRVGRVAAEFGYDTKHAMHLIRLLRMGTEIMEGKGVIVRRPDAEELLTIRNGEWTLDEVVQAAHEKDAELEEAARASKLPVIPDAAKINALLVELIQGSYGHKVKMPSYGTNQYAHVDWTFETGELVLKRLTKKEEAVAP